MESLLRCPLCAQPLDRQDTRYLCPRGHSFDRAAAVTGAATYKEDSDGL